MAKGDVSKLAAVKISGDRARKPTLELASPGVSLRHLSSATFAGADSLITVSESDGRAAFNLLNLSTFDSLQLTAPAPVAADSAWFSPRSREIFYWQETALKSVNIDTLEETVVYGAGYQGGRLSVSSDARLVAFGAESTVVPGLGPDLAGRWALMLVSARGEGSHPILTVPFKIGRVEFSPADPDCLTYTWAGHWSNVPQRIWWTDASGLEGGPLGRQNPNETRGGAYFAASGDTLAYHGSKYHIRRTDSGFFLEETAWLVGLTDFYGTDDRQFYCPGPTGRCRVSPDGSQFVCDLGGAFVPEHRSVALVHVDSDKGVFEPLFFLGAPAKSALALPRPQFSPDASQVVFSAASNGSSNIYLTSLK
jgi:hypothetical protein